MLMSCRQADVVIKNKSNVQEGDLLFCIADEDNAITDVTQGIDGMKIEHVGIYYNAFGDRSNNRSRALSLRQLTTSWADNGGQVVIGRVENADIK